jgi:hypothetical protein
MHPHQEGHSMIKLENMLPASYSSTYLAAMSWGHGMNSAKSLLTAFAETNIDRSRSQTFGDTTSPETKSF